MSGFVAEFVATHKRLAEETGRTFRPGRPTRPVPPRAIERAYARAIIERMQGVADDIRRLLVPEIGRIVRAADVRRDSGRADVDDVEAIMDTIEGELRLRLDNQHLRELEETVRQYQNETSVFNRVQLFRQVRSLLRIDAVPSAGDGKLFNLMNMALKQNVELITSMGGDFVGQTMDIVRRGVQNGDRAAFIEKEVLERSNFTIPAAKIPARAKLIARDQINKLNGSLTRVRQQALGVEKYVWRTSRDERVRNTHLAHEGKIFSWNDPPEGTGHPGHDYQCRCSAEPYIAEEPPPKEDRKRIIKDVLKKRKVLRERLKGKPSARLIPTGAPKGFKAG